MKNRIKILKDYKKTQSVLSEIFMLLTYLRKDRDDEFHGLENRKRVRREKVERLSELFEKLGLEKAYVGQIASGKWSLERVIKKSGSPYVKVIDGIGGPKASQIKKPNSNLTQRLPGSFEGSKN